MITLQAVANAATVETGHTFYVERLGGNVFGAVDYSGLTVTVNGGQREVSDEEPWSFLVCRDGAVIASGEMDSLEGVAELGRIVADWV